MRNIEFHHRQIKQTSKLSLVLTLVYPHHYTPDDNIIMCCLSREINHQRGDDKIEQTERKITQNFTFFPICSRNPLHTPLWFINKTKNSFSLLIVPQRDLESSRTILHIKVAATPGWMLIESFRVCSWINVLSRDSYHRRRIIHSSQIS